MNYVLFIVSLAVLTMGGYVAVNHDTYGGDHILGATSFPTSLDSLTNPAATDRTNVVSHSAQHSNANDAIEALQAKVGADGSAVTTSHDYKLSGVTGSDKACSLTGNETLTNKTLTSPNLTGAMSTTTSLFGLTAITGTTTLSSVFDVTASTTIDVSSSQLTLNLGSDATGDIYYRNASGYFTRLPVGTNGQFLSLGSGIPTWTSQTAADPSIATTTGTNSFPLTVDGSETIDVRVFGSCDPSAGLQTIQLKMGGQEKASTTVRQDGGSTDRATFYLSFAAQPAATTTTLDLVSGGCSVTNAQWTVLSF